MKTKSYKHSLRCSSITQLCKVPFTILQKEIDTILDAFFGPCYLDEQPMEIYHHPEKCQIIRNNSIKSSPMYLSFGLV